MSANIEKVNTHPTHKCSFCDKTNDELRLIIAGTGVCICNECVLICVEIVFDRYKNGEGEDEPSA